MDRFGERTNMTEGPWIPTTNVRPHVEMFKHPSGWRGTFVLSPLGLGLSRFDSGPYLWNRFIPQRIDKCRLWYEPVTSEPARAVWSAFVVWDAKRPVTVQLLNARDLMTLARLLGKEDRIAQMRAEQPVRACKAGTSSRGQYRDEAPDIEGVP